MGFLATAEAGGLGTEQGRDELMLPVRSHPSMNYGLML
jgi:hypothetical protein